MDLNTFKEKVVILVFIALVIAGFAIALDAFQSDIAGDAAQQRTHNESITLANGTATALATDCVSGLTCNNLYNDSAHAQEIGTANYTCSGDDITPTIVGYDNVSTTLYVNYTCGISDYQYNVSREGLEGISNATSYLSTIGTLLGVAALIAIVVGAFMFVRR